MFKAPENAAKCGVYSEKFHFWGRGVLPLDVFGVLMSLHKTNSP